MYRLNFHSYPSHYSIPFEYHYKNTVNCRLNILQGNGTLFGILTQRFFNHYRSNKLYICAKRYLFNKLILTPPVLCQSFSQFYINGNPKMTKTSSCQLFLFSDQQKEVSFALHIILFIKFFPFLSIRRST